MVPKKPSTVKTNRSNKGSQKSKKTDKNFKKEVKKVEEPIKKYDSKTDDDDVCDEHGFWDGSTMTDNQINAIKDEKARNLAIKIDQKRELLVELRDQHDKDLAPDIANLVNEIYRLQQELNEMTIYNQK